MTWIWCSVWLAVFSSMAVDAYRYESGEYYVGGGFGANVNVARFDLPSNSTPRGELPLIINVDYVLDHNLGIFGAFIPSFAAGTLGLGFRGGAKYWFTFLHAPLFPYVSLALSPAFLLVNKEPDHFNIGLSPGAGANFFLLSKISVGAHIHFNPSMAFADGEKKFEFGVMAFFDVAMRM